MKKWTLVLAVCVLVGGCVGCDKEDVAKAISQTQQKAEDFKEQAADPNSGFNKAVDTVGDGAKTGNDLISSPLGVLIPEPYRTGALLVCGLVAGTAAWWQRSRKNLAVKTLGATVNAIESSGAGGSIKPVVKANLIQQNVYVPGKTLIMSVKK
ncbi:MAG: hypothetical protein A2Y07_01205 [Planctomycetes bacterium GWF2_50_10]|nr:MAG: hypothetical protein A2Y07_01205 [Planctomycetes bacterium GWF2_50_10]